MTRRKKLGGADQSIGDGSLLPTEVPIEDFNYDSSGSLSSIDSAFDSLSDCMDPASVEADVTALPSKDTVVESVPIVEAAVKPKVVSPPTKRKRGRPRKPSNAKLDLVTTGAFLTRATLRKLGVADVVTGPDAVDPGFSVGSKVKVLSLDKQWYTAVVLAISNAKALVHYPGWEHGYNEWIQLESRRLVYRGKEVPDVGGSLEAMEQLESCNPGIEDPELAEFNLSLAIKDAFCTAPEDDDDDVVLAAVESDPAVHSEEEEYFAGPKRPRGRPTGSQNRRRAGHIKNRNRRSSKPIALKSKVSKVTNEPEATAKETVTEELEAPPVPEELRIAEVRLVQPVNPYSRRHRLEHSDDDDDPASGSVSRATSILNSAHEQAKAKDSDSSAKASSDNAVWHLTRGTYVTTGAFSTRRTIKSLAQSGSTGGIMQDHHGYYPGQIVEVMNVNRNWYMGRVISYANKKFLIHYNGWNHAHNEWIAVGSKRMRAADRDSAAVETEEDARKLCVILVDEYNAHIDDSERSRIEKAEAKRKAKPVRQTPVNSRIAQLSGQAMAKALGSADDNRNSRTTPVVAEEDEETDEDVEPISVDSGYALVPQLLRVKDYVGLFRKGMQIAARDRNKLWWRAVIIDIKTFRLRIHYTGFSSSWDEWMEMNTQRVMLEEQAISSDHTVLSPANTGSVTEHTATDAANETDIVRSTERMSDSDDQDQMHIGNEHGGLAEHVPKPKRLGRPPGPETKSTPLSLRLALKAVMNDRGMYEQCHPEELDVFHLPKEHMSMKDYSTFLKIGDRVRIRDRDKQWYECTIIDLRHGRIRVCFNGQSDEFNQWIPVNSDRIRILRETIDGDKRLEKLERESQIALRRKREKVRAQRRKQSQASMTSLVRLAENLEYIVDQEESHRSSHIQPSIEATAVGNREQESSAPLADDGEVEDVEDRPLLQVMLDNDSEAFDSMPLMARMLLTEHFNRYRLSSRMDRSMCATEDSATWFVYCNACNIIIRTFRYYCVSCERPSDGYDYESYELCLTCFTKEFPAAHPHPRACFARAAVSDVDSIVQFTTTVLKKYRDQDQTITATAHMVDMFASLLAVYEPDTFDTSYTVQTTSSNVWNKLAIGLHGTTTSLDAAGRSAVLGRVVGRSGRSHITSLIDASTDIAGTIGNADDASCCANTHNHDSNVPQEDVIPRCAFCGEDGVDESSILGGFAGERPFVLMSTSEDGEVRRRRFWAHDACARYSPEVLVSESGQWFNVAPALRRARTIKCAGCKRRGATIGCFHERCQKSYHVMCTGEPKEFFASGYIFWCPKHKDVALAEPGSGENAMDATPYVVQCANCSHELTGDLMWMVCLECPANPEQQFNICLTCYESKDALADHPHKKRCFREHLSHTGGVTSTGQYLNEMASSGRKQARKNAAGCHYCHSRQSRRWRKGYGGVVMCETCFNAAHSLQGGSHDKQAPTGTMYGQDLFADDNDDSGQLEVVALNPFGSSLIADMEPQRQQQGASVEDYTQSIYFTRETCIASNRIGVPSVSQQPLGQLSSYGPTDSMLFTLPVDSTYFDIPGRAPRWGSHSGTDYHGTWLPQTVRRALLRYTMRGQRVLSNFLGRGTDAIECFLLSRKCVGVDINPSAVSLSQRNCSFAIMPNSDMSVEFRPTIMQGDARDLCSEMWPGAGYFAEAESFDHILSHPPYKDCVLYSTNIDGDLSRFPGPEEFQREMEKVVCESWRLLKMGRHLTLGIGDNRAECFYIPVSYQLCRTYIDMGFELDELIVKRQRYCQAFGLGTYLCVQFDFLMFTHEFIATLRKVPKSQINRMHLTAEQYRENRELGFHGETSPSSMIGIGSRLANLITVKSRTLREVPPSPIERKGVVMGSVWTFEAHPVFLFSHLCMSRMVQRFGRDESNWEQIDIVLEHADLDGDQPTNAKITGSGHSNDELDDGQTDSETEFPDNGTRAGGYERERQRQIQQNREQLLHLGLVSELGENSTDTAHYQTMVAMYPRLPIEFTPLALIVVPHVSNADFKLCHVEPYRRALVQITHDASRRLCPSGLLVIGIQDVRDEHGKLWPLGMLVLEDVQRAVGSIRLRLKEFIVVVENGHARKRDDVVSRETFMDEECVIGAVGTDIHVPIVHAYYLVFMKLK
ncbi:hypothetical protein GGH14_000632 [Coemansia sp. RSA 370]|nr:hypothetical protein GGH14_000632 [Coemansia sp. RSA 370]KAJ2292181.1 hypothetical protein IW141_002113 [Coemansia sp. RSA 355]